MSITPGVKHQLSVPGVAQMLELVQPRGTLCQAW